jgi:hypothetical protein
VNLLTARGLQAGASVARRGVRQQITTGFIES